MLPAEYHETVQNTLAALFGLSQTEGTTLEGEAFRKQFFQIIAVVAGGMGQGQSRRHCVRRPALVRSGIHRSAGSSFLADRSPADPVCLRAAAGPGRTWLAGQNQGRRRFLPPLFGDSARATDAAGEHRAGGPVAAAGESAGRASGDHSGQGSRQSLLLGGGGAGATGRGHACALAATTQAGRWRPITTRKLSTSPTRCNPF